MKPSLITHIKRLAGHADVGLLQFCLVLIALDLFFIAVYAAYRTNLILSESTVQRLGREWHIGSDGGYSELFGYVKLAVIVCLLGLVRKREERPIYAALALMFAAALLDDALRLHEQLGGRLSDALGLRYSALGDLLVWITLGVVLLTIVYHAFIKSPPDDRRNGLLLLGGFAVLVWFAIVVDLAHVVVLHQFRSRTVDMFVTIIEDGGEQITLSLITGLTVCVHRELRSRPSLT